MGLSRSLMSRRSVWLILSAIKPRHLFRIFFGGRRITTSRLGTSLPLPMLRERSKIGIWLQENCYPRWKMIPTPLISNFTAWTTPLMGLNWSQLVVSQSFVYMMRWRGRRCWNSKNPMRLTTATQIGFTVPSLIRIHNISILCTLEGGIRLWLLGILETESPSRVSLDLTSAVMVWLIAEWISSLPHGVKTINCSNGRPENASWMRL